MKTLQHLLLLLMWLFISTAQCWNANGWHETGMNSPDKFFKSITNIDEQQKRVMITWQDSANQDHFFQRLNTTTWQEFYGSNILSEYDIIVSDSIIEDNNIVNLYTKSKNLYIQLKCGEARWGQTLIEIIKYHFYDGYWKNKRGNNLCIEAGLKLDRTPSQAKEKILITWQDSGNKEHYFLRINATTWHEFLGTLLLIEYDFVSRPPDTSLVNLFAKHRNYYVQLSCVEARWGQNLAQITNYHSYFGYWLDSDLNDLCRK